MRSALLLIATSMLAAAPASADTRSYNFNSFSNLDISAGYEVVFTQAPQRSVTIESDNFDRIIVEQRGDTLRVARPKNTNIRGKVRDIVRISAPDLEEVQLNAGVKFRVDGLDVDNLTLDMNAGVNATFQRVSANAINLDANAGVTLELAGSCESLRVDASAGVTVNASGLRCRSANVDAAVGSTVRVHTSHSIVADAGIGATIRVAGSPKSVDKHASLGGSVSLVP